MNAERDRDDAGRPRNARPRDELGRPLPRGESNRMPEQPEPASAEEALERGIEFFNAGKFFEAHEAWEFAWHPSPEAERDFWQGITQVAVGFTHFQRGNHKGAVTLLERGAHKLEKYPRTYKGIEAAMIAGAARAAAEEIRAHGEEASPVPPVIQRR